ncbi:MAG TPA: NUDIX hydrolase [Fimbriimonas sp.]|nr:NUDIX hydrolase [Fimbriimonas sp.]
MTGRRLEVLGVEKRDKVGFFEWKFVRFCYTLFAGGTSKEAKHLVFDRGDSVGMLMHDLKDDIVILVEQVRVATAEVTGGWILELPAGRVGPGEEPATTASREIAEETGATGDNGEFICAFYPSPGACSERIFLYYFPYPEGLTHGRYGGLENEGEDIAVHRMELADALLKVDSGDIIDAKAIIALRWLQARQLK